MSVCFCHEREVQFFHSAVIRRILDLCGATVEHLICILPGDAFLRIRRFFLLCQLDILFLLQRHSYDCKIHMNNHSLYSINKSACSPPWAMSLLVILFSASVYILDAL